MGLGYHAGMVGVGRARSGVKEGGGELWTEQKFLHTCGHISEAEGEPCHWLELTPLLQGSVIFMGAFLWMSSPI